MQAKSYYLLPSLLLALSTSVFAEDTTGLVAPGTANTNSEASNIATYLQNLGQYFGYDLTQYCTTGGPCSNTGAAGPSGGGGTGSSSNSSYSNTLLYPEDTSAAQMALFNNFIGSLLGASNASPLVPSGIKDASFITSLQGQSFANPPYSNVSTQNVSVSNLIDQQTYQTDPVSQAVLNILSTADYTYCPTNNGVVDTSNCGFIFREQVLLNTTPMLTSKQISNLAPGMIFTPSYNMPYVSQLNMDTLLTPLMYSTTQQSSNNSQQNQNMGLPAQTQAQQASNFIRYATSAINPLTLPTNSTYSNIYALASNANGQTSNQDQAAAMVQIASYLAKLRSFTAQSSVGISNLYYILSRRLPQKNVTNTSSKSGSNRNPQTSEALDEFVMSSWRLNNPNLAADQQWLNKINKASSATVQKEMAILLAEINYQLYLTRQQQERLLLTESMLLIQSMQAAQPDSSMSNSTGSTTPNPTGSGASSTGQ
jgi:intracellular multiplication protein IcmX